MGAAWTLGPHRVSFEAPDLVRLVIVGPLDMKLLRDVDALAHELQERYPVLYLVLDARQCTGFTAEVRKHVGEDPKGTPFAGVVMFGASFAMRTLATSMNHAAQLLRHGGHKPFALVESEAEAKTWVAGQREAAASQARKTG